MIKTVHQRTIWWLIIAVSAKIEPRQCARAPVRFKPWTGSQARVVIIPGLCRSIFERWDLRSGRGSWSIKISIKVGIVWRFYVTVQIDRTPWPWHFRTLSGWIETTSGDALLILLGGYSTKPYSSSRWKWPPGAFLNFFDEIKSGVDRCIDGFFWSPRTS